MISDERLRKIAEDDYVQCGDASSMAKELLATRACNHKWDELQLIEAGGKYKYCTQCGMKNVW